MTDRYDLERFVAAQSSAYPVALAELRAGAKRSHWMWFVFPQIAGLGRSAMAARYGIVSLGEARAFLLHPLLGRRLAECLAALDALDRGVTAERVFGQVDAIKLRSSLTLFAAAGGGEAFSQAIARWCGGEQDRATLALLAER